MSTPKRLAGPLALTTTLTTNIYQGAGGSSLIYDVVRHIHVVNKTGANATFTIYLGASGTNAAGTELFFTHLVTAGQEFDWYGAMVLKSTDYLVGGSDTATALTIEIEGEQSVVP